MKLVSIPQEKYDDYRIDAIFDCYKWDPQFLDNNTLAKYALVLSEQEYQELKELTEKLDFETRTAEGYLCHHLPLVKGLSIPLKISKYLPRMSNYDPSNNIRLTRYDFHPTCDNTWAVSEVNSDVPGGFAEASLLPKLANKFLNNKYDSVDFGHILSTTIASKIKPQGTIMFVHCTSYSDDRQVMQYIGDKMESLGFTSLYGAAEHLKFVDKQAISVLSNHQKEVDCIFRFTPLEWLKDIKPKTWDGYFDTITPSCNHPIAIFAQTKEFPFIWDKLEQHGIKLDTWKQLLPDTIKVNELKGKAGYIYKPVYGRVGEKIAIQEACDQDEYKAIIKDVKTHPRKYIAQKKFASKPLISPDRKEYHVCIGSYAVDGKHAGFYARISPKNRIDSDAADIPVLIERRKKND